MNNGYLYRRINEWNYNTKENIKKKEKTASYIDSIPLKILLKLKN